jgi:hypothetical protein
MTEQETPKKPGCGVFVICWVVGTIVIYITRYSGNIPYSQYLRGGTIFMGDVASSAVPGAFIGAALFAIVRVIVAASKLK